MLERQNRQAVGKDAHDNRRHAIQQIRRIAHDEGRGATAKFCKIDGAKKADGYADQHCQQKQLGAADNGVRHATSGLAHGCRKLGKEAPTHRSPAMENQIA